MGRNYKKGKKPMRTFGAHRNKAKFQTLEEAQARVEKIEGRVALRFSPMVAYKCLHCGFYHIGHEGGAKAQISTILVRAQQSRIN